METGKNNEMQPRILGLISAEKILTQEGIITDVVRARIRNRVSELLGANQENIATIVLQYTTQNDRNQMPENEGPQAPQIPDELRRALSRNEFTLISALLNKFGYQVTPAELVKAVYDEDMDPSISEEDNKGAKKLRALVCAARKKIKGWGVINSKQGRGYWLEITTK